MLKFRFDRRISCTLLMWKLFAWVSCTTLPKYGSMYFNACRGPLCIQAVYTSDYVEPLAAADTIKGIQIPTHGHELCYTGEIRQARDSSHGRHCLDNSSLYARAVLT